jgi:ABC-type transport system involved in cytochrome c biogenesis permease subunit
MTTELIRLIIPILIFAGAAYGAYWLCDKSQYPKPIYWLVGAIFLIILLVWTTRKLGVS